MVLETKVFSKEEGIPKVAQKELTNLLGKKNVCFEKDLLNYYKGAPFTAQLGITTKPHGMAQPKNVEEVQGIFKIANKYKIPIMVAGTMFSPTLCLEGGLVVDSYTRMRKIHKIDPVAGYALVEPGVSCGQLLKALRPYGYWVPFGSYPPMQSNLVTLVCQRGQTNAIGREDNFCRGLEVVLPTGKVIRTGSASRGIDCWYEPRMIPNLKWLWQPSGGTMGIITKAALRIYPLGEAQDIVVAGFNNFDNALEWTHRITKEVMANTSMIWSYRWVQWEDFNHRHGKGHTKFLNEMLTLKPDQVPEGYHAQYAFASISGYKEQVEGNVKACRRLAKELGGEIINEKFKKQWPGTWAGWQEKFVKHINPGMTLPRSHVAQTEGGLPAFTVETTVKEGKGYHHAIMKRFYEKLGHREVRYYTRQMDHGRTSMLRYVFSADTFDKEFIGRHLKEFNDLCAWTTSNEIKEKFPSTVPLIQYGFQRVDDKSGKEEMGPPPGAPPGAPPPTDNFTELYKGIQKLVDPNNIMDPGMKRMGA